METRVIDYRVNLDWCYREIELEENYNGTPVRERERRFVRGNE